MTIVGKMEGQPVSIGTDGKFEVTVNEQTFRADSMKQLQKKVNDFTQSPPLDGMYIEYSAHYQEPTRVKVVFRSRQPYLLLSTGKLKKTTGWRLYEYDEQKFAAFMETYEAARKAEDRWHELERTSKRLEQPKERKQ